MKNKCHRIAEWIKKNWLMSMIVSAVVGAFITWPLSWILPSPRVEVSNLPQKALTCTLNYGKPLFVQTSIDDDFKILFKDEEIKKPFLYSITIENTGDEPILNEDFKEPLTIDFEKSRGIVKVGIITSSNQALWNEFLKETNIQQTTLSINSLLLNQSDSITFHIITDGKADVIRYNHRTVGLPHLIVRNTLVEKKNHLDTMMVIMLITCVIVVVSVVLFAIIERRNYKKWHRDFNEKYLKFLQMEESTHEPKCEHK